MGGSVRIHAIFHRTPPIVTEETASLWVPHLASANVRATFTPRTDLVVMSFGTTVRCVLKLTESKLEVPTELSSIFKSRHHTPNMRSSWRWPDRTHSRPASSRASPPGVGLSALYGSILFGVTTGASRLHPSKCLLRPGVRILTIPSQMSPFSTFMTPGFAFALRLTLRRIFSDSLGTSATCP